MTLWDIVFVPFLGDLFSIWRWVWMRRRYVVVFVPFLGDFFSIVRVKIAMLERNMTVFVPFPGDFFSISMGSTSGIRNGTFSSPFLGTFFQ